MVSISKNEEQLTQSIMQKINLSKDKVNLEKKVVNLSKCVVNLSKKSKVDIGATQAQVVFVLDNSGSMYDIFHSGILQDVITTLLPVALTFDDNGVAEVYQFSNVCNKVDDLSLENYEDYVKKHLHAPYGTTVYSGPLENIMRDYFGVQIKNGQAVVEQKEKGLLGKMFGKKKQVVEADQSVGNNTGSMNDTNKYPVFVMYITDGDIDSSDKNKMNLLVRESSRMNMFIQFIGASKTSNFNYLRSLDDLDGRECDNTGFVKFDDLKDVSDLDMYNAVLEQYADWLRVKGF